MKKIIGKIDRSIKRLYNLEFSYCAEDFLLKHPLDIQIKKVGSAPLEAESFRGALFVKNQDIENLSIGIYLSEPVRKELRTFRSWKKGAWSHRSLSAFSVAAEEVSHFLYLLHNGLMGRSISQFE